MALDDKVKRKEFFAVFIGGAIAFSIICAPTEPEEDNTFAELRTKSATGERIYMSLRITKLEYALGEEVPFIYEYDGPTGDWGVVYHDWYVYQDDKEIRSVNYRYANRPTLSSLAARTYNLSWDQKDNDGNQVPLGEYTLYIGGGPFSKDLIHLSFKIVEQPSDE